jgi:hypothetical protein
MNNSSRCLPVSRRKCIVRAAIWPPFTSLLHELLGGLRLCMLHVTVMQVMPLTVSIVPQRRILSQRTGWLAGCYKAKISHVNYADGDA